MRSLKLIRWNQNRDDNRWAPTNEEDHRINFSEYNAVTVDNSGAIWTGAGGLTISRSQTSFQNSISALYSYRARYAHAARMNQCFVLFVGSEHSMCNDAQSKLAYIIYGSQTEQTGCDEWQSRIRIEQSVDVFEARSTRLSFFLFLYYAYFIILNVSLCWFNVFFSAVLFTVLTARC